MLWLLGWEWESVAEGSLLPLSGFILVQHLQTQKHKCARWINCTAPRWLSQPRSAPRTKRRGVRGWGGGDRPFGGVRLRCLVPEDTRLVRCTVLHVYGKKRHNRKIPAIKHAHAHTNAHAHAHAHGTAVVVACRLGLCARRMCACMCVCVDVCAYVGSVGGWVGGVVYQCRQRSCCQDLNPAK